MSSASAISSLVTGFPPNLRQPKPLPGETLADLVIRNNPHQWRNFLEHLEAEFKLPSEMSKRLQRGKIQLSDLDNPKLEEELDKFINYRVPTHWRTIDCLEELRRRTTDPLEQKHFGYALIEILWPRPIDSDNDKLIENEAAAKGVRVIKARPTNVSRELQLDEFLPEVQGEYLWLVPGGTRFTPSITLQSLRRVMHFFRENPSCAYYTDNAQSVILRTQPLFSIARQKGRLGNVQSIFQRLKEAGYSAIADRDQDLYLCELEKEYGGWQ